MEKIKRAELGMNYFGNTEEWRVEFEEHVTRLGKAIIHDMADTKEVIDLSPNVALGPLGELAYLSLSLFIKYKSQKRISNLL